MSEHIIKDGQRYPEATNALAMYTAAAECCGRCKATFWRNLYMMRWWRDFLYPNTEYRYSD